MSTAFVLHSIEHYSFLFFLAYFLPNLVNMAGSVLLLLSVENLDQLKAYWGYILTAIALWMHAGLISLSLVFTFLWSPSYFLNSIPMTLFLIILSIGVNGYSAWIDYCYAKHLGLGNKEIVESGRGEGLIGKEMAPGQSGPSIGLNSQNNPKVANDIEKQ